MPTNILECCLGTPPEKKTEESTIKAIVKSGKGNLAANIIERCLGANPEKEIQGSVGRIIVTVLPPNTPPPLQTNKEFIVRESLLTELFNTPNGSSLYRMVIVLSLTAVLSSAAVDFANSKKLTIGQELTWDNVQDIPQAMLCWLAMAVAVIALYCIFCLWARCRSSSLSVTLWDLLFIGPMIVLISLLAMLPAAGVLLLDLAPVCSLGLLMEQVRFFTKTYGFLRAKVPHVLNGGQPPCFPHFFLFLCVPTLIYRDVYPIASTVRWRRALQYVSELTWSGVMITCCMERVHGPAIAHFRSAWLDGWDALTVFIGTLVPTTLVFLAGFFAFFHSFLNLQAELTGFQDRMFYKDWWNATSFRAFFTSWSTLVQDWLYVYVYLDVRRATGSRTMASGAVFLVSGVVHEYVLSFFFRFFYPVLIIVFVGAGLILKSIPTGRVSPAVGNVALWVCIPVGTSIIVTSYMTEFFARRNCPYASEMPDWIDVFIPRTWTCPITS